jgi:flagellar hook-associated protein 2
MSIMNISGLSSGLKWNDIIDQLMQVSRAPEKLMQDQQAKLTTRKQDWDTLSQKLSALLTSLDAFSSLNADTTFLSKISTSSDQSIFTATATAQAVNATYGISNVVLAAGATYQSSGTLTFPVSGSFNIYDNSSGSPVLRTTVNVTNAASLADIAKTINNNTASKVSATVINNALVITDNNLGSASSLTFSDVSGSIMTTLNMTLKAAGTNASFNLTYGGYTQTVTRTTNTITDAINGVTINLLAKSPAGSSYTLTVANDTNKTKTAVQDLVNKYNDIMDYIAQLSGDKGDLQGDYTLASIKSALQYKMTDRYAGTGIISKYDSLGQLGITTDDSSSSLGFNEKGKLSIDDTKLTAALQDNPAAVEALFQGINTALADFNKGYLTNLVNSTSSGKGVIPSIEDSLQNSINDITAQIQRMEDRLAMEQKRLVEQFTAMEKAISGFQAQGNWLTSQIATLTK